MSNDDYFMNLALDSAKEGRALGNLPVGAF